MDRLVAPGQERLAAGDGLEHGREGHAQRPGHGDRGEAEVGAREKAHHDGAGGRDGPVARAAGQHRRGELPPRRDGRDEVREGRGAGAGPGRPRSKTTRAATYPYPGRFQPTNDLTPSQGNQ